MNKIIIKVNKISGIVFYVLEYYVYLIENNLDFKLIMDINSSNKNKLFEICENKYQKKYLKYFENIIFKKIKIEYIRNLIIFDFTTFELLNKRIFYKNCFYNYTNSIERILPFNEFSSNKNIITFGDKETGCNTQNDFPLCLNFKMFKKLNKIENKIFVDIKNDYTQRKLIKNFQSKFNVLNIKSRAIYDKANRMIPESKFYNKKIIIKNKLLDKTFDSINTRIKYSWKKFDINKSNFHIFIKENLI